MLEAVHVKWRAFSGQDSEDNGMTLCVHHRLFDRGAMGINYDFCILVSQHVYDRDGSDCAGIDAAHAAVAGRQLCQCLHLRSACQVWTLHPGSWATAADDVGHDDRLGAELWRGVAEFVVVVADAGSDVDDPLPLLVPSSPGI